MARGIDYCKEVAGLDNTTLALVVAGLGVLATPLTAWLTFRWTRASEKERWYRERDSDVERWEREERKRRLLRGEDAAKEILTAVDKAQIVLARGEKSESSEQLRPLYHEIKQQAELLTDDHAQARIAEIADNILYNSQARELNQHLTLWTIGHTCSDAAHAILRAYLHGRPLPETPRMDRLQVLHKEGGAYLEDVYDDYDDPLAEPVSAQADDDHHATG